MITGWAMGALVAGALVTTGIAAQWWPRRGTMTAMVVLVGVAASVGVLRPHAPLALVGRQGVLLVGILAAQRGGWRLASWCDRPWRAALGGVLLGGWVSAAMIVAGGQSPRPTARLALTAWLAAALSPLGGAIGLTALRDGPSLAPVAITVALCLVALSGPGTVAPAPPSHGRELTVIAAVAVAALAQGSGVASLLTTQIAPRISSLTAFPLGALAGSLCDPAVGVLVVSRALDLAPPGPNPALHGLLLGLVCAPGPVAALLLRRFGWGAMAAIPWLLVPLGVGAGVTAALASL